MSIYKAFFRLKDSPFRLTADPEFLCMTAQHREALSGLVHSVCSHSGLTVLVGEAGTGKTTLIQALWMWLERLKFTMVVCTNPIMSREELYDMLVTQLGVECISPLKNRQLKAIEDGLRAARAEGRRTVLVVDEAHKLPSDLLEEVRLLLNLETTKEKLLEIVLAGQPELMSLLRQNELRQLKQRVSSFCRLQPLQPEELQEYVNHRLAQAGLPDQTVFSPETLELVHMYSDGIPRVVNTICENAMLIAFAMQEHVVTREMVAEAASDLDLADRRPAAHARATDKPSPVPINVGFSAIATASAPAPERIEREEISASIAPPSRSTAVMPLENYPTRQKSLNFLASLVERWK